MSTVDELFGNASIETRSEPRAKEGFARRKEPAPAKKTATATTVAAGVSPTSCSTCGRPFGAPANVSKSLEGEKAKYLAWLSMKSPGFHPSAEQLGVMFSKLEEGDEILPDFMYSFTVRKPDGRLLMIDRLGRIGLPSPYAPTMKAE